MMRSAGLPDHHLNAGQNDTVMFVGVFMWRSGCARRTQASSVYVVVHRSAEIWTHVYRVIDDPQPGRILVFLERALAGDCAAEACGWVLSKFGNAGKSTPEPRMAA